MVKKIDNEDISKSINFGAKAGACRKEVKDALVDLYLYVYQKRLLYVSISQYPKADIFMIYVQKFNADTLAKERKQLQELPDTDDYMGEVLMIEFIKDSIDIVIDMKVNDIIAN